MTFIQSTRLEQLHASQCRVLIIEDNLDQLSLLKDIIGILGFTAKTASNARHGIELARRFQPHIVICDIGLPDMSGIDVALAMRADDQLVGTRMIALSGYGSKENIDHCLEAGFDRFLLKPADVNTIEQTLTELLNAGEQCPA